MPHTEEEEDDDDDDQNPDRGERVHVWVWGSENGDKFSLGPGLPRHSFLCLVSTACDEII